MLPVLGTARVDWEVGRRQTGDLQLSTLERVCGSLDGPMGTGFGRHRSGVAKESGIARQYSILELKENMEAQATIGLRQPM